MSRSSLSATDSTQAGSAVVGVVVFVTIALPTGTLYFALGDRSYTFGGNTYTAVGDLGGIGNYNETADSVPRAMALRISGVDQTLIGNITGNHIQGVAVTMQLGFTDASHALLDNPSFVVNSLIGDVTITLNEGTGVINIAVENLLADLQNRYSGMLLTGGDQRTRFAGDTFLDNIAALINKVIYWGQLGPNQVGVAGAGGGTIDWTAFRNRKPV